MSALPFEKVESYQRDGFIIVRGVIDGETLEALLNESSRLWGTQHDVASNHRLQWRKCVDGSIATDRIDPVLDISPLYKQATEDVRITALAGQLMHCMQPKIFKAKLISKWPGTTGYSMHQDYSYWSGVEHVSPNDFITAMLALDPSDDTSGVVELFPSLHHSRLSPAEENSKDVDERVVDLSTGVHAILKPGDIAFFHSMTPHRSGSNRAQHNRQALFFTYVTPGHSGLTEDYYLQRPVNFMESP